MGQYYVDDNINEGTFESYEAIIDNTFELDYENCKASYSGVPLISDGHSARGYHLEQPLMILANTGSGKTMRIVLPYAMSCIYAEESMILTDPKGELYKHLKNTLDEHGYKTIVMDMRNPRCGEGYNLWKHPTDLYKLGKKSRADELMQSISTTIFNEVKSDKDPFWHITSSQYLTGLAEMLADLMPAEDVTFSNIYKLHLQGEKKMGGSTYIKSYFSRHEDALYWNLIYPFVTAPNETKSSLASVFTSAISKYVRNEDIVDQMSHSTFGIEDLIDKKTAIFIVFRDESSVYNGLITALIDQFYEILIDKAEELYNGKLKRRINFILDEFGNLAAINDINSKITVSRSRNIGWCLCSQSLEQLTVKYGIDVAKIILGNCNLAYMYSNDLTMLKMISELCGHTTDEYTQSKRPLLSVERLRHFSKQEGQTLFLLERLRPFITYLPFISEYPHVNAIEDTYFGSRNTFKVTDVDLESMVRREMKELFNHEQTESLPLAKFENVARLESLDSPASVSDLVNKGILIKEEIGDTDLHKLMKEAEKKILKYSD